MLLDERRERVLQIVENKGFVSLQEIADLVRASESTVRRDLEYLDGLGQIRRTRGGASYVGESITGFEERRRVHAEQKLRIARFAAELIEPGETILLDGGTTTLEVAHQLVGKPISVVTNSLPIANVLVNQPQIELVMVGGYLYPKTGVALGMYAEACLANINVRRLVMSTGGITEQGLFNSNLLLVETERKMMEAADEVLVVADSSKFGHSALVHLCELHAVDRLIIDDGLAAGWEQRLRSAGIEVHVVGK